MVLRRLNLIHGLNVIVWSSLFFLSMLWTARGAPGVVLGIRAGMLAVNLVLCLNYLTAKRWARWAVPGWFALLAALTLMTAILTGQRGSLMYAACYGFFAWNSAFSANAVLHFLAPPWRLFRNNQGRWSFSLDVLTGNLDDGDEGVAASLLRLSHPDERVFKALAKNNELGDQLPLLRSLRKPAFRISASKVAAALTPRRSKFGGFPDLPAHFVWPAVNGEFLEFFAQINLAEVPQSPVRHLLPASGQLCFFGSRPAWDLVPGGTVPPIVRYFPPSMELVSMPPPDGFVPEAVRCEAALSFSPIISLLASKEIEKLATGLPPHQRKSLLEWVEFEDESGDGSCPSHQLLGASGSNHHGGADGGEIPPSLLLRMDTDAELDLAFADSGFLEFLLPSGALQAEKWESCWHTMESL